MRKSSRLPKALRSIKRRCPACGKLQLMQDKFTKDWKCQKCGFLTIKGVAFDVKYSTANDLTVRKRLGL